MTTTKSDLKPIKIKATVYYAQDLSKINTMFDPDNKRYAGTFGNLSDAACEALKETFDIRFKEKDVPGKHIVAKSLYKFSGFTPDGKEIPAESIGSGTEVELLVTGYRHKLSAKTGASPTVVKMIVTDLKEYNPERSVEDADSPAL